jgi:RHS repeat-associated protein
MYDSHGTQTWSCELSSYGEVRNITGTRGDCPFRYQGQYEDVETGLYYNRFRYYDPNIGNYLSQDPIGLAGGNPTLYGYVEDVNGWVDVLGLKTCPKKKKKRGPKTKSQGGLHNKKIGMIATKLQNKSWNIEAGGNIKPEILIKTGGLKNRRPDIIATKNGKTKIINVGKKDANGNPIKREKEAITDLENVYGKGNVDFVAYN